MFIIFYLRQLPYHLFGFLQGALALHWSISRSRSRLDDMRGEHQTVLATLETTKKQAQEAKDALKIVQAELDASRPKLQEAEATKAALAAARTELEGARAARAALDAAKAKAEEAKAALATERAASSSSMEAMLYHCWVYNPDGDFSFMGADAWESFLEKFKARLQHEAPSETEENFAAAEQEGEVVTSSEQPGGA